MGSIDTGTPSQSSATQVTQRLARASLLVELMADGPLTSPDVHPPVSNQFFVVHELLDIIIFNTLKNYDSLPVISVRRTRWRG